MRVTDTFFVNQTDGLVGGIATGDGGGGSVNTT